MAESAGRTRATSFDGGHGKGLFQIDDRYWKISKHCAFDAACNTGYAYVVWRNGGWRMWATYGNKSYCKYLSPDFKKRHERRCL